MYYYINQNMTWFQAQNYCREHYTDLATFDSYDDTSMREPTLSYKAAWIGLFDDPKSWKENLGNESNSWRWSVSGEAGKTTFEAWASGEPSFTNGSESCVVVNPDGTWGDATCAGAYAFVCYTVTNQTERVYHFIPTVKSWNSAQEYCRQHYTDLAVIENAEENALVFSKTANQTSWIGLYRVPWTWSDGSHGSFKNWRGLQPDNLSLNQFCVVEVWPQHYCDDVPCSLSRPFICHQGDSSIRRISLSSISQYMSDVLVLLYFTVTTLKTTVGMKIMTDADMTDPAVIEQFLQQIVKRLTNLRWTDFKLQWKNLPSDQTKKT
ncbi:hypothetical protein JOB18_009006 [Solea senegalensis]|uniref:C-type lectin domain-containing protein n=1 Tax=Solea senegalensis TaxID=28829 RepID=A0AAV6PSZ2_SOLSE|nr:hypothetical protein JOB18_009006 [Solea senegalensis]